MSMYLLKSSQSHYFEPLVNDYLPLATTTIFSACWKQLFDHVVWLAVLYRKDASKRMQKSFIDNMDAKLRIPHFVTYKKLQAINFLPRDQLFSFLVYEHLPSRHDLKFTLSGWSLTGGSTVLYWWPSLTQVLFLKFYLAGTVWSWKEWIPHRTKWQKC